MTGWLGFELTGPHVSVRLDAGQDQLLRQWIDLWPVVRERQTRPEAIRHAVDFFLAALIEEGRIEAPAEIAHAIAQRLAYRGGDE